MTKSANGWTLERRQKQREAIQRWQPWKQATGPRSENGKQRVSKNAYKGGLWLRMRVISKRVNGLFRKQQAELRKVGELV